MSKQFMAPTALFIQDTNADGFDEFTAGDCAIYSTDNVQGAEEFFTTAYELDNILPTAHFQLVWKKSTGEIETTPDLKLTECVRAKILAYNAGTAQITHITPAALVSTPVEGDSWIVRIINTTDGTANVTRKNFEVVYDGAAPADVNALLEAMIALINADTETAALLTATEDNTKLILTADSPEYTFRVAVDGDLVTSNTISYNTNNLPATGTSAKTAALELECMAYDKGITNLTKYPVVRPASEVVSGTHYNIYVFEFLLENTDKSGMYGTSHEDYKLYIAEVDGASTDNHVGRILYDAITTTVAAPQ